MLTDDVSVGRRRCHRSISIICVMMLNREDKIDRQPREAVPTKLLVRISFANTKSGIGAEQAAKK